MKNYILYLICAFCFAGCAKYTQDAITNQCDISVGISTTYPQRDTLKSLLDEYSKKGIPGLSMAVYTPTHGFWGTTSGYAKIEAQIPMQLCHLQYLQSASKMYMAVAILKLKEQGKITLDSPITKYLPARYSKMIQSASTMSVKNLLNQTSGIPDYLANPSYITYILQHPSHFVTTEEFLGYIRKEKQHFPSGSKYEYSNTNFLVLSLIADEIIGDHNEIIRQQILAPLGLNSTYYRNIKGHPDLVNSYLDRYSTGILENVSQLQQTSISFSKGDDGIIATPIDAIKFLKGLMEGKLLAESSLKEMLQFVNNSEGQPTYGMGIFHINHNGNIGYGHGGAGAGAGCGLYYFPEKQTYVFLGTNIGTLVDGPITEKTGELKNKILDIVLAN